MASLHIDNDDSGRYGRVVLRQLIFRAEILTIKDVIEHRERPPSPMKLHGDRRLGRFLRYPWEPVFIFFTTSFYEDNRSKSSSSNSAR